MVSLEECRQYDYPKVKNAILKTFKNLGGIEKYINKGDKVLLKTNLVMRKSPESAAITHPYIIQSLAEILIDYGAYVEIGDSPGGPFNSVILKSIYKYTGIEDAAKKSKAILSFDTTHSCVKNSNGLILKNISISNMVLNADKIISVGKLKTHSMTTMTGAVKNMFGAVPGAKKAEYHFNYQNIDDFAKCIIDICRFTNPVLSFLDAVVGMEGNGPTAGKPRDIGIIMASENPFDLDLSACKVINIPAQEVPILNLAIKNSFCQKSIDDIKFVGENIENYIIKDFEIPQNHSMHFLGKNPPKIIEKFFKRHLYPYPTFNQNCIGCGVCAENCPAKIITINKKAHADLKKCIHCYCCQELCPKKAVDIKKPYILKILSKL